MRGTLRALSLAVALLAAALALPALASANLYCVNEPSCVGGAEEGTEGVALQKALTNAEGHAGSTVLIGPGTYTRAKGFAYSGPAATIRGAGVGVTVLTTPLEGGDTVLVLHSAGSTLSGLSVAITAGEGQQGMLLNGGTVEDVAISGGAGTDIPTGLSIIAGVFSNGSIEMSEAQTSLGVNATGGEVLDSTIAGSYGVDASLAVTLRGDRISSNTFSIDAVYADPLTIEDTLVYLRGSPPAAISLSANSNGNGSATLRGVTIIDANGMEAGIELEARQKASSALLLEDSVIENFAHPILEADEGKESSLAATTDYSSFQAANDVREKREESEPGGTVPAPPNDENQAPAASGFVHPVFGAGGFTEGDWRLLATSPLIGAGTPGGLPAGQFASDLAGNPRIVDGARDVGAYEYQRGAPVVSASASAAAAYVGEAVSFSGSATDSEPGDAIAGYQWSFDDGAAVPAGATASHAFTSVGLHTATLTARDLLGVGAAASVQVMVTAAGPIFNCSCLMPVVPGDLKSLHMHPRAFHAAHSGPSTTRSHKGSLVSFTLTQAATVAFTVTRVTAGVEHGGTCAAPRHGLDGKRCSRHARVHGSITRSGNGGANSFHFTGRLGGRTLAPGSYVLGASAAGEPPVSFAFTVLR